jgi:tetratricopeptide (TPR) repeat protein
MHYHFSQAALLAGDLAEAETHGQQALSLSREMAVRREEGLALRALGEIATTQEKWPEAEELLKESLSILKGVGEEYEWARSQLSLARVYACLEQPDACQSALDSCTEVFNRLGASLDLETTCSLREGAEAT